MTNSGGTTKEGWEKTSLIISAMASAGVLVEAGTMLTGVISGLGLINSVDDIGQNRNGEGIISQNIKSPEGKNIVEVAKKTVTVVNATTSIQNVNKTVKSPFTLVSMFTDLKDIIKNGKEK